MDSNSNRQRKIKASGVWILLGLFVSVELNPILRMKNYIPFQNLIEGVIISESLTAAMRVPYKSSFVRTCEK